MEAHSSHSLYIVVKAHSLLLCTGLPWKAIWSCPMRPGLLQRSWAWAITRPASSHILGSTKSLRMPFVRHWLHGDSNASGWRTWKRCRSHCCRHLSGHQSRHHQRSPSWLDIIARTSTICSFRKRMPTWFSLRAQPSLLFIDSCWPPPQARSNGSWTRSWVTWVVAAAVSRAWSAQRSERRL